MPTAAADDEVDMAFDRILKHVITTVHEFRKRHYVSHALLSLLVRCANSWQSIRTLRVYSQDDQTFTIDGAVILRCIFDAYLQADSIYRDPNSRETKASLYLEFAHVDRYRAEQKTTSQNTSLAKFLNASPRKSQGTENLRQQYERVKANYCVGKPDPKTGDRRVNDKWYAGNLRQFAVAAGKEAEYDTFITQFCGCVHSGAFSIQQGPLLHGEVIGLMAATMTARVVQMNVELNRIELTAVDIQTLDSFSKSFLEEAP